MFSLSCTAFPSPVSNSKTQSSRESRAGFLSTILFWWLLPLIWHGFRNPLRSEDLEELQPQYEAGSSHERLSEKLFGKLEDQSLPSMDPGDTFVLEDLKCSSTRGELGTSRFTRTERGSAKPPVRSLILATLLAFPVQILKPISWRLILIAAQLSQPFLVSNTLSFAQSFATGDPQPLAYGWGLVGATTLVYGVVGLSTGQVSMSPCRSFKFERIESVLFSPLLSVSPCSGLPPISSSGPFRSQRSSSEGLTSVSFGRRH